MEINPIGLIAAMTTFMSVWLGHVYVRKIEANTMSLWKPMVIIMACGIATVLASISVPNRSVSTVLGVTGIILLWDVFELKRQERRVRKGHSPANPNNSRHVALLAKRDREKAESSQESIDFSRSLDDSGHVTDDR